MATTSATTTGTRLDVLALVAFILAFLFSPAGLVCGIIGLVQINRTGDRGKGLAVAAIVLSIVFLAVSLLLVPREFAMQHALLQR